MGEAHGRVWQRSRLSNGADLLAQLLLPSFVSRRGGTWRPGPSCSWQLSFQRSLVYKNRSFVEKVRGRWLLLWGGPRHFTGSVFFVEHCGVKKGLVRLYFFEPCFSNPFFYLLFVWFSAFFGRGVDVDLVCEKSRLKDGGSLAICCSGSRESEV